MPIYLFCHYFFLFCYRLIYNFIGFDHSCTDSFRLWLWTISALEGLTFVLTVFLCFCFVLYTILWIHFLVTSSISVDVSVFSMSKMQIVKCREYKKWHKCQRFGFSKLFINCNLLFFFSSSFWFFFVHVPIHKIVHYWFDSRCVCCYRMFLF